MYALLAASWSRRCSSASLRPIGTKARNEYPTRPYRTTMIASDENSNGPMFQVWSWSESSECGRQIDIYRWAIDYLLERSLPIPTQLTNRAAALLMQWQRELETLDPVAGPRH